MPTVRVKNHSQVLPYLHPPHKVNIMSNHRKAVTFLVPEDEQPPTPSLCVNHSFFCNGCGLYTEKDDDFVVQCSECHFLYCNQDCRVSHRPVHECMHVQGLNDLDARNQRFVIKFWPLLTVIYESLLVADQGWMGDAQGVHLELVVGKNGGLPRLVRVSVDSYETLELPSDKVAAARAIEQEYPGNKGFACRLTLTNTSSGIQSVNYFVTRMKETAIASFSSKVPYTSVNHRTRIAKYCMDSINDIVREEKYQS